MNRQVNYIIYAILLSLLLPMGYYFIKKIITAENFSPQQAVRTVKKQQIPQPSETVIAGKSLFVSKCAACHGILHGEPGLMGFEERGPWQDRNNLYEWIRNPAKFMEKDPYARRLKEQYGSMMRAFPEIKNEEIDAIVDYINYLTHYGMAQSANVE